MRLFRIALRMSSSSALPQFGGGGSKTEPAEASASEAAVAGQVSYCAKKVIGQGSFGIVILVDDRLSEDRKKYALKIINKSVLHHTQISVIHGESKILFSLAGKPNVV